MFAKRLCILWLISIGYVLVITLIFYNMPFWKNIYIKDIVVWFIFSGLMYCVNAIMTEADEHYISKILKDNVKASIFIEFLMSTFTFNIWIELAIIPIVTVISIINMFLEKSKEYEKIAWKGHSLMKKSKGKCGLKCILLFLVGACVYYNVEICFRGHSHWTMAVLGGILFIIIGNINRPLFISSISFME